MKQVAMLLLFVFANVSSHAYDKAFNLNTFAQQHFPQADRFEQSPDLNVMVAYTQDDAIGYSFTNDDIVSIPAYSGKPINSIIAMDAEGNILAAELLEHHEPILLVGIPEIKLENFVNAFTGFNVTDQVRVGSGDGEHTIDAITGATVTVMVVNEAIMKAANKVARHFNLAGLENNVDQKAKIKLDYFSEKTWGDLVDEGAIANLRIIQEEVNESFINTEAAEQSEHEDPDSEFIDLYFTPLNIPSIGRNLLGENEYNWLLENELQPGDVAIAVMANGDYSFKGNGYVRGGIFDRTQLHQNNQVTMFRDLDYIRLSDIYVDGFPGFSEMAIFISRAQNEFDFGAPWKLELLVRRQTGPIKSIFQSFYAEAEPLEEYIQRPDANLDLPLWQRIWYERAFQTGVVIAALVLLMGIIFLQDVLVKYPKFLRRLHTGYLLFTVFFIGWYSLGQLSIVNVFTFVAAVYTDFHWDLFLLDPIIFSIWGFVAVSLLLWGRGIYCGWLCPFGAIQELVNVVSRKLKIKQYEFPHAVHERLWAVKYIILLALFAVSLESLSLAERFAEVEPFKTTIMLKFQREWGYVFYALLLIAISIFNRKFYCRYVCPLGAALAIPARISLFDWLRRRKECGDPCQLCAVECEIQAIDRDGNINPNECHYCLDCQMTYYDDHKCPPLVNKRKNKKSKQDKNRIEIHEVV